MQLAQDLWAWPGNGSERRASSGHGSESADAKLAAVGGQSLRLHSESVDGQLVGEEADDANHP